MRWKRMARSGKKVIAQNCIDRAHAIFPVYLLTCGISTATVGNSDLINSAVGLRQFGRDFRFESETVFTEIEIFDQRSPEDFVARFQICKIKIREHVREQRQKPVTDHVPEIKDPMWSASHET